VEVLENRLAPAIFVTTTADELNPGDGLTSLREAINAVNAGQVADNTIVLPAGTYKITIPGAGETANATGDFNINHAVTIQGAGAGSTIIDGNGLDRVFSFELAATPASYTATINGVTIQGGSLSGARGAGIQVNDSNANPITLNINNSTIQNNTNNTNGNSDGDGGGINSENGSITLTNCTVANNSAGDDGGGVNEKGAGTLTVINCTIQNNLAFSSGNDSDGGGIDNEGGGNIVVMNCLVTGNRANGDGGGIDSHKHPGDVSIINSTVSFNTDFSTFGDIGGGGIAQEDNGKLTITNCLVTGNTTSLSGGGIADLGTGAVTITGSQITGNVAEKDGGGLFNTAAAVLNISSSTFSSNQTDTGNGGGLNLQTTALGGSTLTNVTISDNAAGGNGGGIWKTGISAITLQNDTVAFNSATNGGGLRSEGAALTLVNTVVANNDAATANPDVDNNGANANLVDGNNNFIGNNTGATGDFTAGTPNGHGSFIGTSGTPLDPLLGALRDNGGTVVLPDGTHLLTRLPQPDSGNNGVLNRATNGGAPATDERGVGRPQGPAVDIGAVERDLPPSLTGINSASPLIEGATVALSVFGTNFTALSAVHVNGNIVPTAFVSSSQLTATVTLPATEASASLVVTNPDGGPTTTLTFSVHEGIPGIVATPNQKMVNDLFEDLLGSDADAAGLNAWTAQLNGGVPVGQVALNIMFEPTSREFLNRLANQAYLEMLNRAADPAGLMASVTFLASGGKLEVLQAILASSGEFAAQAAALGVTPAVLFYWRALGRAIDPAGAAAFAGGAVSFANALSVLTSAERYAIVLNGGKQLDEVGKALALGGPVFYALGGNGVYEIFLHRAADAGGLNTYTQQLLAGVSIEVVLAEIAASPEYTSLLNF
jgi:hypothetical protein